MTFIPVENGWLAAWPSPGTVASAKNRLAARTAHADSRGAKSYFDSDLRWVGDLGEMGFDHWLERMLGAGRYGWNGGLDGEPDFVVATHSVGLKTRYSNVATRGDFYAVVPAQHFEREQEDQWFFANYETRADRLVLLGGIDKASFRAEARFVDTGEPIGPTITAKNPVWQLPIAKLEAPYRWLCSLDSGHALIGAACSCGSFAL